MGRKDSGGRDVTRGRGHEQAGESRGKAPGKKTRVEQRYGPRPGKAVENARMDVQAFERPESSTPVDSWRGDMFFHVGPDEEPRAHLTGRRDRSRWQWSDPAGATLRVNSDAEGKTGQLLSEWAPARASYMEVP